MEHTRNSVFLYIVFRNKNMNYFDALFLSVFFIFKIKAVIL